MGFFYFQNMQNYFYPIQTIEQTNTEDPYFQAYQENIQANFYLHNKLKDMMNQILGNSSQKEFLREVKTIEKQSESLKQSKSYQEFKAKMEKEYINDKVIVELDPSKKYSFAYP